MIKVNKSLYIYKKRINRYNKYMSNLEKLLRNFADFVGITMGQKVDNSYKNSAPLWSVIGVAFIGIITLVLLAIAVWAYFIA
ncbi:MAG: hypothetical protein MUF85_02910 [Patescibacteria group bacterium]|nr:hypothetical protein [Patescibacteria group bacterium]